MHPTRFLTLASTASLALTLSGCIAITSTGTSSSSPPAAPGLGCTLTSNCVNSVDSNGLPPLRYNGTSAQGLAALQATLAQFPEAKVVRANDLVVETVFTTAVGFKDEVEFRLNPQGQRIDFRSQSTFGLYDFGKNRARMLAFAARFAQVAASR